jgi:hypothetical protein
MDRIILDHIPFEVEDRGFMNMLRIQPGTRNADAFSKLLEESRPLARPKAAFAVASPRLASESTVEIGGAIFTSRVLCANLEKAGIAFPFAATCGAELEEWAATMSGMLHSFWADSIMLMALGSAVGFLEKHLKDRLEGAPLSSMNPGSLEDWPLTEQAPLFHLLGESATAIGMRLSDKMVLRPLKSLSGIQFASREGFVNCALCPRESCGSRRAAYDPSLYAARFSRP